MVARSLAHPITGDQPEPGNHRPGNHRPGNHRPGNHKGCPYTAMTGIGRSVTTQAARPDAAIAGYLRERGYGE
ncbi:MAG: hypothetical protein IT340_07285 [Chloroflexi bacterium]|nr:hypothetical protein [Chloroflexota bacterium]